LRLLFDAAAALKIPVAGLLEGVAEDIL